jgi:hypothetical protein
MGHKISHNLVAELLKEMGYSLQANKKTLEGTSHPDRNAQFEHINNRLRNIKPTNSPSFLSIPRKRNWSGISKIPAVSSDRKESPKKCEFMIL